MIKVNPLILLLVITALLEEANAAKYTAMYIFGDSLIDAGSNKYFPNTIAKANFPPYGMDFSTGPSGRFCNGKILVDFIGELLGLPLLPSYADVSYGGASILSGVNFASAAAGILNDTGYLYGHIVPLQEQISNMKKTVGELKKQMEENELRKYLARALVMVDIGANDYLNNYLIPLFYKSSRIYSPQQFADLLIEHYRQHILEIQSLGLRKFLLAEGSPIGCIPVLVSKGKCMSSSNNMVRMLNTRLRSLVDRLKTEYPGSVFMLGESFRLFFQLYDNAEAYGFKVKDQPCCGDLVIDRNVTKPLCSKKSFICGNRDEYVFWDYAHPTQAANRILAHLFYNATSWQ